MTNNAHAYHSSVLGDDGYVYVIGGSTTPSSGGGTGAVDKINTFAAAAPEYLSAPQQYAVVGEAYDAGAFFKGNPRPTSSHLLDGPGGMSVDPLTGVLNWTPTIDQVGLQSVTLEATNEFGTTEATFDIETLDLPPDVHAPGATSNLRQTDGDLDSITFAWDAARTTVGWITTNCTSGCMSPAYHKYWGVAADNIVGTELTLQPANSGALPNLGDRCRRQRRPRVRRTQCSRLTVRRCCHTPPRMKTNLSTRSRVTVCTWVTARKASRPTVRDCR